MAFYFCLHFNKNMSPYFISCYFYKYRNWGDFHRYLWINKFFQHVKLYYHLSTAVPYLPVIMAKFIGKTSCFLFRVPTLRAAGAVVLYFRRTQEGSMTAALVAPFAHTRKLLICTKSPHTRSPPTIPALSPSPSEMTWTCHLLSLIHHLATNFHSFNNFIVIINKPSIYLGMPSFPHPLFGCFSWGWETAWISRDEAYLKSNAPNYTAELAVWKVRFF